MRSDGFIVCEKCGKKLIKRLPDGDLEFAFGKSKKGVAVRMKINGLVEMVCIDHSCNYINIIQSGMEVEK